MVRSVRPACAHSARQLSGISVCLCLLACSSQITPVPAPSTPVRQTLLIASLTELDFGTVSKGGRAERTFSFYNPGLSSVEIGEIRSSCDCFRLELAEGPIAPLGKRSATARLDLSDDAEFVGRLDIDVTGLAKGQDAPAFVLRASIGVDSTASKAD